MPAKALKKKTAKSVGQQPSEHASDETLQPAAMVFNRFLRVESRADRLIGDAGAVILRQIMERTGIVEWMIPQLTDPRRREDVVHDLSSLLRTSVLLAAQGWGDHDDAAWLGQDQPRSCDEIHLFQRGAIDLRGRDVVEHADAEHETCGNDLHPTRLRVVLVAGSSGGGAQRDRKGNAADHGGPPRVANASVSPEKCGGQARHAAVFGVASEQRSKIKCSEVH